jgi:3-dehydroquinate synthase
MTSYSFSQNRKKKRFTVNTIPQSEIIIGNEWNESLSVSLSGYDSFAVVTDANLVKSHGETIEMLENLKGFSGTFVLEPGEEFKDFSRLRDVLTFLLKAGLNRGSAVVAFGGGVVTDLAGLAASLFMRGIDILMMPSSLLAMVDASIGGKTGINHPLGKNLIGTFHQPRRVFINSEYLRTLPQREYESGLAEVLKYGFIFDRKFLEYFDADFNVISDACPEVMEEVISFCAGSKAAIVTKDADEKGLRMLLNYGHTFGHALETFFEYRSVTHGEAVNLGMIMAEAFAASKGLITQSDFQIFLKLHEKLPLDRKLIERWEPEILADAMFYDKKRRGDGILLILPYLNSVKIYENAEREELINLWEKMKKFLSGKE